MLDPFPTRPARLAAQHAALVTRPNEPDAAWDDGLYVYNGV